MTTPREVTFRLARHPRSVPRARALLLAVLNGWEAGQEALETAELVLSELVTNALRVRAPQDRQVGVRIAHSAGEGLLRLEVSDAGTGRPEVREPCADDTGGRGLLLVDALTYRWGVTERAAGIGKTVWVDLKATDFAPPRTGREVAAVTVRAGQRVRVWGAWRTVRGVRGEQYTSGGPVVVLELDEGPVLRLHAAEPVSVRDNGEDGPQVK